ncbi:hypothetical protein KQX54_017840 [Cotesia glomerata]|uniref:Uncharacterized protein n=2 Tax=Cotesia glomerata TaxID=32391 RepID=A0AAV7I1U6_COTGL|nr:hypothetical protein KQX54_017840 [Cotesia glomerata]
MYQRNGLNIDLTIDGNILSSMTVTNYMPFKMCSLIPGSLSSKVCLNILELNIFSRSITVCPRLDFMTQNHRWILTYTCISISTLLPDMNMAMPINSAMIVKFTTNRPQSSTSRSPSQQIQTAPTSNQMISSLSVNSPSPMVSKPQSTVGSSEPTSAKTKSTSPIVTTSTSKTRPASSTVTMMTTKPIPSKTKPATAPMSTTKPTEPTSCKITSESSPK